MIDMWAKLQKGISEKQNPRRRLLRPALVNCSVSPPPPHASVVRWLLGTFFSLVALLREAESLLVEHSGVSSTARGKQWRGRADTKTRLYVSHLSGSCGIPLLKSPSTHIHMHGYTHTHTHTHTQTHKNRTHFHLIRLTCILMPHGQMIIEARLGRFCAATESESHGWGCLCMCVCVCVCVYCQGTVRGGIDSGGGVNEPGDLAGERRTNQSQMVR